VRDSATTDLAIALLSSCWSGMNSCRSESSTNVRYGGYSALILPARSSPCYENRLTTGYARCGVMRHTPTDTSLSDLPNMQAIQILIPLAAYLIGSVSAAIIVCRLMKLPDPRSTGSGNPGATNVLRVGGKTAAAITLAGDALKGFIPVFIAARLEATPLIVGLTALAAVLGHLFPVFFQFKGGKGVATSFGAIFGLAWLAGLLTLTTWLAMSLIFRMSSVAALVSLSLMPLYLWITTKSVPLVICGAVITVLVYIRHKANIVRIVKGEEPRITGKKS